MTDRAGCGPDDLGEVGFDEVHLAAEAYEGDFAALDFPAEPFVAHAEALRGFLRGQQAGGSTAWVDCVARAMPFGDAASDPRVGHTIRWDADSPGI